MGKFYRINQYIQAKEVRVIDETGKQIGVMPIFNAIQKARELGKDLVEITENANPPICKIIDFQKFKYQEEKKEKEQKKGKKGGEIKEILLTPFISSNDLEYRIKKAKAYLQDNNKVKVRIRFRGRELGKQDFGHRLISRVALELGDVSIKESEAKFAGKELFVTFIPNKNKK